jgi:hypothetical protein
MAKAVSPLTHHQLCGIFGVAIIAAAAAAGLAMLRIRKVSKRRG